MRESITFEEIYDLLPKWRIKNNMLKQHGVPMNRKRNLRKIRRQTWRKQM